jgi:hypothetical protein
VRVRPGDSLLIAGLVREADNFSSSGPGFMQPIIPTSRAAESRNLELVFLMRPRVIVYTNADEDEHYNGLRRLVKTERLAPVTPVGDRAAALEGGADSSVEVNPLLSAVPATPVPVLPPPAAPMQDLPSVNAPRESSILPPPGSVSAGPIDLLGTQPGAMTGYQ